MSFFCGPNLDNFSIFLSVKIVKGHVIHPDDVNIRNKQIQAQCSIWNNGR